MLWRGGESTQEVRMAEERDIQQISEVMSQKVVHSDPEIMHGTPVFIGTRVPAESLFHYLEAGYSLEDLLTGFPSVTREQATRLLQQAREAGA